MSGTFETGRDRHRKAKWVLWLALLTTPSQALCQKLSLDEIQAILKANPPATGDPFLRDNAILNLDEFLKRQDAPRDADVREFYLEMLDSLPYELALPVPTGARVWQMYNDGFIVKTPSSTFAFDLVNGYSGWNYRIPNEVLQQIQVAFISHVHGDHSGGPGFSVATEFGGELVSQSRFPPGTETTVRELGVAVFFGLHGDTPNNIFHVTTPEGVTVMHTGDTQRSRDLPSDVPTDILLINAWMNESGSRSATVGVRNGVNSVSPSLTIPGHVQELGHTYNPAILASRVPYAWPLAVDDLPIPGDLSVMAWGERYEYNVESVPVLSVSPGAIYTVKDDDSDVIFDSLGDLTTNAFVKDRASIGECDSANVNVVSRMIAKFALPEIPPSLPALKSATLRFFVEDAEGTPSGPVSVFHSVVDNDLVPLPSHYEDTSYHDSLRNLIEPGDPIQTYYELDVTDLVVGDYETDGTHLVAAFRLQMDNAELVEDDQGNRLRLTMTGSDEHQPQLVLAFVAEPSSCVLAILGLGVLVQRFFTTLSGGGIGKSAHPNGAYKFAGPGQVDWK